MEIIFLQQKTKMLPMYHMMEQQLLMTAFLIKKMMQI